MMQEVQFKDVPVGESFISLRTKRAFGGIKIQETPVQMLQSLLFSGEERITVNAVILADHVGERAHDCGTLISLEPEHMVSIDPRNKRTPFDLMKEELHTHMG